MSDESSSSRSGYRHHDGTPGSAADRSAKVAIPDSFPASDPVATTPAVGLRAVALPGMTDAPDKLDVRNPTTVTARFHDHVTAKLAIEKLVRGIPLDRRCAVLSDESGRSMLEITTSMSDMERVMEMLRMGGGDLPP